MEINNVVYLSGTSTRVVWDWTRSFKFHLNPYYVHDADALRRETLAKGPWTSREQELEDKLKNTSKYEVYVVTPEMRGFHTIAEAVDAAHRRKNRCIFLALKAIQGPGINLVMTAEQMRACDAVEELVSAIGGRVFRQPTDVINFLLNEANN